MHPVGADDWREDAHDARGVVLLQLALEAQVGIGNGELGLLVQAQQAAGLVHHGHVAGIQSRHAGGYQVLDTGDLYLVQGPARVEAEHHRGAGRESRTQEGGLPRDAEVYPRLAHAVHGFYGLHQLFLQRPVEAGPLDEVTGSQGRFLVEHGEALAGLLGQAAAGQHQARAVNFRGRDLDVTAARVDLVVEAGLVQGRTDPGGFLGREARVQQPVVRRL